MDDLRDRPPIRQHARRRERRPYDCQRRCTDWPIELVRVTSPSHTSGRSTVHLRQSSMGPPRETKALRRSFLRWAQHVRRPPGRADRGPGSDVPDQSPADRPCARWHSPGPSRGTLYRRVAFYMARLLKGAKPGRRTGGAADEIRASHPSQDCERAGPHHPAHGSLAAGRGAPVSGLANHLVRLEQEAGGDCQAERLGRLEVDDQVEVHGLLDR